MKFLHLMHLGVYSSSFIELIENNFDMTEHAFFFWGCDAQQKTPPIDRKNVYVVTDLKSMAWLIMNMFAAKKIYINGLFMHWWLDFIEEHRWILKKSNWIVWGGDLYYYKERPQDSTSELIEEKRKRIIPYFYEITAPVEEYEIAVEAYNVKGKRLDGPFAYPLNKRLLDRILKYTNTEEYKGKKVRILIGNRAAASHRHFEAFQMLEKFKNENIEIICPLANGDLEYGQQVEKQGREIFGEKFISIQDYMDTEKYAQLLTSIDIGIFVSQIAQGASNIYAMTYLGVKLYLHKENWIYSELKNKYQVSIFDVDEIAQCTFENFVYFSAADRNMNKRNVTPRIDDRFAAKIWAEQHFFL